LLKGGPGTGFGTGLGNQFMAQTGLDPADPANWQRSTAFALDQAKANGWGAWYGAKAQGITGFMGIDRGASNAVGALDKLASSSVDTAASLTSGLGSLGKNLANVFPAAPTGGGGGGIFGFLGNLFGGGRSISATAMAAVARGPGGLYDVGGYTGHGGKYDVAGYVHRGEFVFDADSTARIGVSNLERLRKLPGYAAGGYVRALPHANGNAAGGDPLAGLDIKIGWARGASGMLEPAISDVVRRDAPGIARQQSQGAIAEYHENQRRGGFGTLQKQYSAQKG
jgi:phage-related minor tail protein